MTRPYTFETRHVATCTDLATTLTASPASPLGGSTERSRGGLVEAACCDTTVREYVKYEAATSGKLLIPPALRADTAMLLRGLASTLDHWADAAKAGRMRLGTPEEAARLIGALLADRALEYLLIEPGELT